VLNYIKETVSFEFPGITLCNIKFFISNFEPAILGEMTVAFPSAVAKVCWFYYGQAIYRKAALSPRFVGFIMAKPFTERQVNLDCRLHTSKKELFIKLLKRS
jgi:hypothetical protein